MNAYRLRLLGPPSLDRTSHTQARLLGPGKPLALLAYLAVRGPVRRDELIALLWGDIPEDKARNAFRQTLHRLRTALGEAAPTGRDLITLEITGSLSLDLRDFESALDAGRAADATQLYRGDFLAGLDFGEDDFDRWVIGERSRIAARFRFTLIAAAQSALEAGEIRDALGHATRLSSEAPLDSDAAILEATILISAARKPEALLGLETFRSRLEGEVGSAASPALLALIGKLKKPDADGSRRVPGRTTLPFVGRDSEIAVLLGGWRRAKGGEGGAILLDGAAGIGKTRLIDEFLMRVRDMGSALLLRGRERQGGAAIPHASIAEALRGALAAPGLAGASQHLLAEAARLLPELRDRFALPVLSAVSDDAERVRFFEGVAAFLDAVAYEQPVCVVLEDLHNASTNTLDLVRYLTNRLRTSGVLFVLSARNGALGDRFPEGSPLHVHPLGVDAARALALEALSAAAAPPLEVDEIVGAAEGVPLKIIETARRAAAGEPIAGVPAGIRDILWARLQGASPPQQRLFVAVALFDRVASLRLLARASHLSEVAAFESALALEHLGLVAQEAGGIRPAHDVAASLALDGTGSAGLALLASWAADALAAESGVFDAELAQLYALAGRSELAFTHSIVAAYQAMTVAAPASARRQVDIAGSFASTEEDRQRVASLRTTIGDEPARLPGETLTPTVPSIADTAPAEAQTSPPIVGDEAPTVSILTPDVEQGEEGSTSPRAGKITRRGWPASPMVSLGGTLVLALLLLFSIRARDDRQASLRGRTLTDTLELAERVIGQPPSVLLVTGDVTNLGHGAKPRTATDAAAVWSASVKRPWLNPAVSPDGRFVSVERVTASGSHVYVISANRRDTIPIAVGSGDDISSGWSPDGHWLLVIHGGSLPDGTYDSDLYAYSVQSPGERIALDTSRSRSVVDAVWSPDGLHVAWSARTGPAHQQDIFVSRADGSGLRNLSNNPREDYNPAWSADGTQVGFTSERSGQAQLYAADAQNGHVRRLTYDEWHDDRASYSPNGQFVAFESTRGGEAGVYVMPSWGGTAHRVTTSDTRLRVAGWRGATIPYLARLRVQAPEWIALGDSGAISVLATDQRDSVFEIRNVQWTRLDPSAAPFAHPADENQWLHTSGASGRLVGRRPGFTRLVASVGGWRSDTAFVRIGAGPVMLARDDFEHGLSKDTWTSLGEPAPRVQPRSGRRASAGLAPMADREWDSGVLSRAVFAMRGGLSMEVWMRAPFTSPAARAAQAAIALVAEEPREALDPAAPQFLRLVSISWLGEAGRIGYAVEQEIFTEPAAALGDKDEHIFRFSIEPDGRVAFYADDKLRWRSTVRATRTSKNSSAQLWLGGRNTASDVTFDDVDVWLAGEGAPRAHTEIH